MGEFVETHLLLGCTVSSPFTLGTLWFACPSVLLLPHTQNAVLSFGAERYPQMTLANCCRGLDFIRKKQYKRSLHNGVFAAGKLLLVLVIF